MRKANLGIIILILSISHLSAKNAENKIIEPLKKELKNATDDNSKAIILNKLSFSYVNNNLVEAINYGLQALKLAKKANNKKEIGGAYANLGYAYTLQPDYVKALDNLFKALKIFEKINDIELLYKTYFYIGEVFVYNKNYKQGHEFYTKALKLKYSIDRDTSILLCSIGDAYLQTKEYQKALNYFLLSLPLNKKLNDKERISLNLTNLGITYNNLKKYSKGIAAINESISVCNKKSCIIYYFNIFEIGRVNYLKALETSNQQTKKMLLNKAIMYLEKSLICFQKNNSFVDIQETNFYIYKAYKELGNYELALNSFENRSRLNDSIFSNETKKKLIDLENQREINLRDKKIEIQNLKINSDARKVYLLITITTAVAILMALFLWMYLSKIKVNRLLTEKNQLISDANHQKDKFFSIIAHDLRDPFNGFLGLTELMAEDLDTMSSEEIKFAAINMRSSATNLFRLLENLLEWSRMEQGLIPFTPEENSLLTVVSECIVPLKDNANTKKIQINNYITENTIAFADKNSLHAVIRNVLSNAVKFTPKSGAIHIKATEDHNVTTISISDSGIGMNTKMVEDLFRLDVKTNRTGTNDEPSSGLGLILCKEFIEKHEGKIWVESEEEKGTTFHFSFPKRTQIMYCA